MSIRGHIRARHAQSHQSLTVQDERAIAAQAKRMRFKNQPRPEPDSAVTVELRGIELDRRGLVAAMLMGARVHR